MIDLLKDSVNTINDFENQLQIFFVYDPPIINDENKLFSKEIYSFLLILKEKLLESNDLHSDLFKSIVQDITIEKKISSNAWKPIRIALTGHEHGPDISKFIEILGSVNSANRIKLFLDKNVN